jgi:hypothetical protein
MIWDFIERHREEGLGTFVLSLVLMFIGVAALRRPDARDILVIYVFAGSIGMAAVISKIWGGGRRGR